MFKHLFSTMNEVLDHVAKHYPTATSTQKAELDEQLHVLKAMSDECIESWLLFEEKLGAVLKPQADPSKWLHDNLLQLGPPPKQTEQFARGQGYYKLLMYDKAIAEFEDLVKREPDFLLARVYLAMAYLRSGETADAYRHFQFLLPLTENNKMKAISYNVMGCIQMQNQNVEIACHYFKKAFDSSPECLEPLLTSLQPPPLSGETPRE
ncbi:tetratricopeptide repeat protein [Gordoniibacillus kamchatkensis]|uniref:tetratricopeptide repeat protein n=1 Tax=Gordoniibacillus kamchatkensis TaxID=1590651 RepID=UPI000695CDD2|nr:tetratricopeptide repeat protein [Paenibacillus sp. VKM B-2647]